MCEKKKQSEKKMSEKSAKNGLEKMFPSSVKNKKNMREKNSIVCKKAKKKVLEKTHHF